MNIIKDIGLKEPYVGITPLVSGEIAEDFTKYYAESEQVPTVIALGVLVDKNGVKKAGGYMISLMPDAGEEEISKIENAIGNAKSISAMLDDNLSLQEIAEIVTGDDNLMVMLKEIHPQYKCDCNKDRFRNGLSAIGKEDLEEIVNEEEQIETVCHFCNKKYIFSKDELEEILNNIK